MFNSKSKVPTIVTSIYGVLSIMAFVLMFATIDTESLSGIFVVLVAMPWSIYFSPMIDSIGIDSIIITTLFMVVGVMINAFLIYSLFSFIMRKK